MKRICARLVAATAMIAVLGGAARAASPPTAADAARRLQAYMAARAGLGQFAGVVLVSRGGRVLIEMGYGFAEVEDRVPNTPATRFRLASVSKQFTAAAVLKLRDAGKLSLDDGVCRYLDACPDAWRAVTISQLLHHTSGTPDYEEPLEMGSAAYAGFMARPDNLERIEAEARAKPLDFPPGSRFSYSNTGYILLARVIEKVSGETYGDYLAANVLAPAGLTDSGALGALAVPRLAHGYVGGDLPRKTLMAGVPIERVPMQAVWAGELGGAHGDAALYATARDLMRWEAALDAGKVIKPSSVAEMRTAGLGGYGMGVEIGEVFGRPAVSHTGIVMGTVSRLVHLPGEDLTVAVLSNMDNSRFNQIARDLEAIALGEPYDTPRSRTLVEPPPAGLDRFAGDYTLGDHKVSVVLKDGMLQLSSPGRFNAGLVPTGRETFYVPFLEGDVTFRTGADGKPTGFVLHYQGRDTLAPRAP